MYKWIKTLDERGLDMTVRQLPFMWADCSLKAIKKKQMWEKMWVQVSVFLNNAKPYEDSTQRENSLDKTLNACLPGQSPKVMRKVPQYDCSHTWDAHLNNLKVKPYVYIHIHKTFTYIWIIYTLFLYMCVCMNLTRPGSIYGRFSKTSWKGCIMKYLWMDFRVFGVNMFVCLLITFSLTEHPCKSNVVCTS